MKYIIDTAHLANTFVLPQKVADEHLKLAGAVQLKVLLYIFRNIAAMPDAQNISSALGVPVADINDALRYWCDAGILYPLEEQKTEPAKTADKPKTVAAQVTKPDRAEVAKRGLECPEIAFLLQQAQQIFGRNLRQSEASTLVWLYDDQGMGVAVLLMLIQYAMSENRCNIGFIERTALDWINSGVTDLKSAEQKVKEFALCKTAWGIVCSAFHIDRAPSKKEQENAHKWVNEWGYDKQMLKTAYDLCVDTTSKMSLPYIDKIVTGWHKQGVKTLGDIEKIQKPQTKTNGYDTYDLSLAERILKGEI
mgnify:CR=1 FL=1